MICFDNCKWYSRKYESKKLRIYEFKNWRKRKNGRIGVF